jgi:hypothetical protein
MSFTDVRHASRRVTLSIVLCVKAASGSTEKGPAEAGPQRTKTGRLKAAPATARLVPYL